MLPPAIRGYARRKTMRAWFDNRVSWQAIQHWLKGRRRPPAWAREILQARVNEHRASIEHIAAVLAQKEKAGD